VAVGGLLEPLASTTCFDCNIAGFAEMALFALLCHLNVTCAFQPWQTRDGMLWRERIGVEPINGLNNRSMVLKTMPTTG
jgi:hypothetical protein